MLVLSRRIGESLRIGNEIEIIILKILGNQVQIGVNAPKTITVDREEVYLRKKAEQSRDGNLI